jgi:hypothetical protein
MSKKWMLLFMVLFSMANLISHAHADIPSQCVVQPSTGQVTLKLESTCPFGEGLWGDRSPSETDSTLWIQCRYDSFPLSEQAYSFLFANVSAVIVEQHDGTGYRCLIGPYSDHQQAKLEQQHLKTNPQFATAFLREVK